MKQKKNKKKQQAHHVIFLGLFFTSVWKTIVYCVCACWEGSGIGDSGL